MTRQIITVSAMLFAAAGAAVPAAVANPPLRPNQPAPDVATRPHEPEAGYLRTNKLLFLLRRLSDTRRLNAVRDPHNVISGNRSLPIICVNFKNVDAPYPADTLQQVLFGSPGGGENPEPPRTLTQYYRDVSGGRLQVTGRMLGWYQLPKDDTHYENNRDLNDNGMIDDNELANGDGPEFGELLTFGLQQADAEVDFGEFDNDGRDGIPNSGDDDGRVDTVFFVHPEAGAECGAPQTRENIWSHFFVYRHNNSHPQGHFVTNDVSRDADGNPRLNADGSFQQITVADYTVQPALRCPGGGGPQPIQIGVFCHEYGHALGLPDLYDRTSPRHQGLGCWCLMSAGSYGWQFDHPDVPTHMSAWCKYLLGWSSDQTIVANGSYQLTPVEDQGQMYRLDVPGTGRNEYFLVEYRHPDWRDDLFHERVNWDMHIPAPGLAIWHVDEAVGSSSPRWPFAGHDQGQNDAASLPRAGTNPRTFANPHALIALIQRDRQLHLERNINVGDTDDLFVAGDSFGDDAELRGGSRGYDAQANDLAISDISLALSSATLVAQVTPPSDGDAPPALTEAAAPATRAAAAARVEPGGRRAAAVDRHVTFHRVERAILPKTRVGEQDRETLDGVVRKLSRGTPLTPAERSSLKQLDRNTIEHATRVAPSAVRHKVKMTAARERTEKIDSNSPADSPLESQLSTWQRESGGPLTVQFSPDHRGIEWITGLSLPVAGRPIEQDAKQRIDVLHAMAADEVQFERKTPEGMAAGERPVEFEQVYRLDQTRLPIFGAGASVYYNRQGQLSAIKDSTVPSSKLHVAGTPGQLSADEAKALIAEQLNLPKSVADQLRSYREGIYLVGGNPEQARVTHQYCLPVGKGQCDIHIFVDAETKAILTME